VRGVGLEMGKMGDLPRLTSVLNRQSIKDKIFRHLVDMDEVRDEEELAQVMVGCRKINMMVELDT
jgi:hypothetical protein